MLEALRLHQTGLGKSRQNGAGLVDRRAKVTAHFGRATYFENEQTGEINKLFWEGVLDENLLWVCKEDVMIKRIF